jgi:hypothetical protein
MTDYQPLTSSSIYSFNSFVMEKRLIVNHWVCGKLCGKKIRKILCLAKILGKESNHLRIHPGKPLIFQRFPA